MHWKPLTAKQNKKVLESHIFVKRKQDDILKVQQVAGGSSRDHTRGCNTPYSVLRGCAYFVQTRIGMLLLLISQMHFLQTVVKDEKERAFILIYSPLFDILVSIAPNVYEPYVTVGNKGKKQLLV